MSNYIYDTSALLNGAYLERDGKDFHFITPVVLKEIENIKTSASKDEAIKAAAREFVRYYRRYNHDFVFISYSEKEIEKIKRKHAQILNNNNDSTIICYALRLIAQTNDLVILVTSDMLMYEIACALGIAVQYYEQKKKEIEEEYTGWKIVHPTNEQFVSLYTNPKENIFNCLTNQYVELFEDDVLKDLVVWTGEKYESVKWQNIRNPYTQEIVKPRNSEQKMLMNLLQNKKIPVKISSGKFGSGKSYVTLMYALDEISKGRFDKIIFIKNNLEAKGSGKLATLPGGVVDKLLPWLMQISDIIGEDLFNQYLNEGVIEPVHLSGIRGRTFKNAIIYADECENFMKSNLQLLISRVGEGSEIILCGDMKQNDYRNPEDSGFLYAIEKLKGNNMVGIVKLIKTERSPIAALADRLD